MGVGETVLKYQVSEAVNGGKKNILLNMAGVGRTDSSGIGALVAIRNTVDRSQGKLVLLNPQKALIDLLTMTRLKQYFSIYVDEASALAAF